MEEPERPAVAAEVRAWIVVGFALLVQMSGGVWFAATLNAEVKALRETISDLRVQLQSGYTALDASRDLVPLRATLTDHESRIRAVERGK